MRYGGPQSSDWYPDLEREICTHRERKPCDNRDSGDREHGAIGPRAEEHQVSPATARSSEKGVGRILPRNLQKEPNRRPVEGNPSHPQRDNSLSLDFWPPEL